MKYIFREIYYFLLKIIHKIKNRHVIIEFRAKVTKNATFEGYNKVSHHSFFSGKLGYGSYVGANSVIIGKIGKYTCIAENVSFLVNTHPVKKFASIHPCFYSLKKQSGFTYVDKQLFNETPRLEVGNYAIEVGNDVYIGYGATIIGPRMIGNGAVIAANSVVTHDVEPYSIVAGNPAKVVRKRFDDEEIAFLEKFQWWDKSPKWLKENADMFSDIKMLKLSNEI